MNFLKGRWKRDESTEEDYTRAALLDKISSRLTFLSESDLRVHADHLTAEDYPAFFTQLFLQMEALAAEEREAARPAPAMQAQLADVQQLADERQRDVQRLSNDLGVKEDEVSALQAALVQQRQALGQLKGEAEACLCHLLTETLRCRVGLRKNITALKKGSQ